MKYRQLLFCAVVCCWQSYAQLPDSLSVIFSYPVTVLPQYKVDSTFVREKIRVERITYLSTDDFVVSAYITHPKKQRKKNPLAVFVHWGEGSYVFMTGIYSGSKSIAQSQLQDFVEWRNKKPHEFQRLAKALPPFDASVYLPYKTVPCLIQVAEKDEFISAAENNQFIDGTPLPKEVKKYDAIHRLDQKAQHDRKIWILAHLGL